MFKILERRPKIAGDVARLRRKRQVPARDHRGKGA